MNSVEHFKKAQIHLSSQFQLASHAITFWPMFSLQLRQQICSLHLSLSPNIWFTVCFMEWTFVGAFRNNLPFPRNSLLHKFYLFFFFVYWDGSVYLPLHTHPKLGEWLSMNFLVIYYENILFYAYIIALSMEDFAICREFYLLWH